MSFLFPPRTGPIQVPFNKFLTEDGLGVPTVGGSGNYVANGDYSLANKDFYFSIPPTLIARIDSLSVLIKDIEVLDSGRYGSQTAGQVFTGIEGVTITVQDAAGNILNDVTQGIPIQTNTEWERFARIERHNWGAGDEVVGFSRDLKHPMRLQSTHKMVFSLNGDFSNLTGHHFIVGGIYENAWH